MAAKRHLSAAAHNSLCTAWRQLVGHVGCLDVLVEALGMQKSHASEFGAPHTGRSPTLAVALEADALAGKPIMAAALAAAQGYRLEAAGPARAGDVHHLAVKVVAEVGEAFATLSAASADGHLCLRERAELLRDFGEVEAAVERVMAALRAAAGGGA